MVERELKRQKTSCYKYAAKRAGLKAKGDYIGPLANFQKTQLQLAYTIVVVLLDVLTDTLGNLESAVLNSVN